jgi:glyoxylase-like metal-dependent hydrolase (beta-lactamase superfamily II)
LRPWPHASSRKFANYPAARVRCATYHTGGNDAFAKLAPRSGVEPLKIMANENVLRRLTAQPNPPEFGLPIDEYFTPQRDFHFNGEAVILYHERNAHTDGDSVVLFRGSDVVATGDVFTPGAYPFIDVANGGSVQGEIDALGHILQLTVPAKTQEGGTYVIPGHGRICDEADVVEFRDMIVIVRDRVRDMMKKGMTLAQIQAAKPTRDYDTEYIKPNSFVTADQFVEAIYRSMPPQGAK